MPADQVHPVAVLTYDLASARLPPRGVGSSQFWLYRHLTARWVNAYNVPGTRHATTVAMLMALAVLAGANVFEDALDVRGSLMVGGAVLGVGYAFLWRWVERRLVHLWQTSP